MPFHVRCPWCLANLRVPNKVAARGKFIACPECKNPVEVGGQTTPATPDSAPIASSPSGIPEGILDDSIVVPLAREERVRGPRPARSAKKAEERRGHEPKQLPKPGEHPPQRANPIEVVGAHDNDIIDSSEVELVDSADVELVEVPEAPAATTPPQPPRSTKSRRTEDDFLTEREREQLGRLVKSPEWNSVRTGLNLIYIAACLFVGSWDVILAALVASVVLTMCGMPAVASMVTGLAIVIAGLIAAGAGGVSVAGHIYCCGAPPRRNAQTLAIVAACLQGAMFFCYATGFLVYVLGAPVLTSALLFGAILTGIAHPVAFLFFLRALALGAKKRWLADSIRNLLIGLGASIVTYPLLVFIVVLVVGTVSFGVAAVSAESAKNSAAFAAGMGVYVQAIVAIGMAWALGLFVWFMNCLVDVIHEIKRETGRSFEGGRQIWVPLITTAGACLVIFVLLVIAMRLMR